MFDIIAAVNDEQILKENLLKSPLLKKPQVTLKIQRGYSCAAEAYNAAIPNCRNDFLVFAHQDVYIPDGWEKRIAKSIDYLNRNDFAWAVLGIFGATKTGVRVGYVWSSGLNKVLGAEFSKPVPVGSVDELLIVCKRVPEIRFDDDLPGFHLYGTDLTQSALRNGKGVYVVCAPVIHNSRPVLFLDSAYFAAYEHLARKWKDRLPIQNCVLPITGSRVGYLTFRVKHAIRRLLYANVDRSMMDRRYDCVDLAKTLGFERYRSRQPQRL